MRAILLTGIGGPEVLEEGELDYPAPRRGEVTLRVEGCGICYRDTLVRRGLMKARIPVVPGHEIAGRVAEIGEGVEGFREGDLAASLIYIHEPGARAGEENIARNNRWIGEDENGCYAEYVRLPYWILEKIGEPGSSPPEAYSFAACVVGTAYRAISTIGKASPGEVALITGASGGVGIHAVQVARALGLRVIATTRKEEMAKAISSYGAEVVVYKDRFAEEVRKLTDGQGADLVIDTVGVTLEQSVRAAARGGRVVLIGNVDPSPQPLSLGLIILKEMKIGGCLNATKRELSEAISLLRRGLVRPVYKAIPLDVEAVREAHASLERGASAGRVVIRPSS